MSFPVMPFLLLAATAHAAAPLDPSDDFSPMLLAFSLLGLLVLLVLVGIGIFLAALAVAMLAILVSLGILSTAVLVGLARGRWSSGVRMILYQGLALRGPPGGMRDLVAGHPGSALIGGPTADPHRGISFRTRRGVARGIPARSDDGVPSATVGAARSHTDSSCLRAARVRLVLFLGG